VRAPARAAARKIKRLATTKAEAVNEMIEETGWSVDVPNFVGGKGTAPERRSALRAAFFGNRQSPGHG
jgi:hypothetical protein